MDDGSRRNAPDAGQVVRVHVQRNELTTQLNLVPSAATHVYGVHARGRRLAPHAQEVS